MNISTWIIICSLAAACLAGIIATLQFLKQKRDDKETIQFQSKLIQKQDTIESLQHLLGQKSDRMIEVQHEIIDLQNKLRSKNEEIQALQNKTIQTIKGTDKPPIFKLANNLYKLVFTVTNESPDLNAYFGSEIYDFTALQRCKIRNGNIIDDKCAQGSLFLNYTNISLKPKQSAAIRPEVEVPLVLGTIYKYLIYTEINDTKYLQQVYINASRISINTLIRIYKFDGKDYNFYSEPFRNSEHIDWDKEFEIPKVLIRGLVH